MLQENQAELTAQTPNNVNPLQEEVNPASAKNPEDSSDDLKLSMIGDRLTPMSRSEAKNFVR